jgi:hypothetical protein
MLDGLQDLGSLNHCNSSKSLGEKIELLQWETELITLLYTLDAIRRSLNILEY